MNISAYSLTDIGRVRTHNEDSYGAFPELGLWVVCDGMGGHDSGEVASAIAVETVSTYVRCGEPLDAAILHAHQAILDAPLNNIGRSGMGTTIVALHVKEVKYKVCWVGDSRAYLWNGSLQRLTHDHSYVQGLVDAGVISAHDAKQHPKRNIITQALGVGEGSDIQVGVVKGGLAHKDRFLLFSDGLTGELDDEEIEKTITNGLLKESVCSLMQKALNGGGRDNITIQLIEFLDENV